MAANLGEARGEIVIGTQGVTNAERKVDSASKKMTRDLDGIGKGVSGITDQFRKLDSFLGASFLAGAAVGIGKAVFELGEASAKAEQVEASFAKMAEGVGQDSDKLLDSMREVSRGVVTDANLIINANRAIGTGVADTSKELNQILEIARATGIAYGKSTTEAYQRIVEAVSKLEPELLDELGITVRLDQVFRSYAASLGTTAERLTDAQRKQAFLNEIIRQSKDEVAAAANGGENAADKYARFDVAVEKLTKTWGEFLNVSGLPLFIDIVSARIQQEINLTNAWIAKIQEAKSALAGLFGGSASAASSSTPAWMTGVSPNASGPLLPDRSVEKAAVKLDWAKGVTEVNERMYDEIVDAERDYGQQRADAVKDYIKGVAREERDFQRGRQRDTLEHLDSIADIYRDATRRESKAAEALTRQLGKAREDTNERLAELDEDYQRNREKAARDHRDNLLEAAGRLDAKAVAEAQRNFKRQEEDAKESHEKQRDEIKERLQEQIDEANEAHARQLEDARQADAERVQDMKEDFAKRQTLEDEDRAIRNADRAQDQADQLAAMDVAHADRLAQIEEHAVEERAQLKEEADTKLAELGVINKKHDDMMARRMFFLQSLWDEYMGHVERSLGLRAGQMPAGTSETDAPPGFGLSASTSGGISNRTSSISGVNINIYPTANQSPYDIAAAVDERLFKLLEEMAN